MRTLSLIFATLLGLSSQAHAWGWHEHRPYYGPGPVVVHPIRPSYPVYTAPSVEWRTGHWVHSWHGNRFGWWWVNGAGWSFYAAPVYPYPEPVLPQTTIIYEAAPQPPPPQVTVVQPAAPVITQTMSAQPVSGDQAPPSNGMYYFCESSQLYYPYAKTCSERWKAVPNMPAN